MDFWDTQYMDFQKAFDTVPRLGLGKFPKKNINQGWGTFIGVTRVHAHNVHFV